MSALTIAPYFPLRRIKIINQNVLPDASGVRIHAQPDKQFQLLCHFYSQKASTVHSWSQRTERNLNLASAKCGSAVNTTSCLARIVSISV